MGDHRVSRSTSKDGKERRLSHHSTSSDRIDDRKKKRIKRSRSSSSSSSSSSSRSPSPKKKRKKRSRSSSSFSSSSSSSASSSSSSSSSSDGDKKKVAKKSKKKKHSKKLKKKDKKQKKKEKKLRKKEKRKLKKLKKQEKKTSEVARGVDIGPPLPVPDKSDSGAKSAKDMKPMTKEEWEKKQSEIRRVYDPETGRNRLVRGDGEIVEEIVSRDRHKEINKIATAGDGNFYQKMAGLQ